MLKKEEWLCNQNVNAIRDAGAVGQGLLIAVANGIP
jgi:hypothetical protein